MKITCENIIICIVILLCFITKKALNLKTTFEIKTETNEKNILLKIKTKIYKKEEKNY